MKIIQKCPYCETKISSVDVEDVDIKGNDPYHGTAFSCPSCKKILSVGLNPYIVATDAITSLLKKLGRLR